jgi:hypothetical protein
MKGMRKGREEEIGGKTKMRRGRLEENIGRWRWEGVEKR